MLLVLVSWLFAADLPEGFVARPVPPDGSPEWRCANHGRDWHVALDGGVVRISPSPSTPQPAPIPFALVGDTESERRLFARGPRHAVAVPGGHILGFDRGEFGGGLYFFARNGKSHHRIAPPPGADHPQNVHALVRDGADVLAFQGLAHLARNAGFVVRLRKASGRWTARFVADLGRSPSTVVEERPGQWLAAVTDGVIRVRASGNHETLWRARNVAYLYPQSIVVTADRTVYVGMRGWVARLRPDGDGVTADLLAPPDCASFHTDEKDVWRVGRESCRCAPVN